MNLAGLEWFHPWFLLLLPLALLPWFNHNLDKTVAWVELIPVDPLSQFYSIAMKLLASLVFAALVFALASPSMPEKTVERVVQGAEIVLVLDRSSSMDNPFAVKDEGASITPGGPNSKRRLARDYLTEFIKNRPDERYGFVFFSNKAINLLPLTYDKKAVLATIDANALGRGLSDTDIADALKSAAEMFKGQTYRGSRIVLLVSDGGGVLTDEEKKQIRRLYRKLDLTIYWIFLKSNRAMTLEKGKNDNPLWANIPARKLHSFFKSIGVPYQAFEASTLEAFSKALSEIDKQHHQTLIVEKVLPHKPKANLVLWLALLALMLLTASHAYTFWGVKKAHE